MRRRAVVIGSSNVLVRSEEQLVAVIGLQDVVVVATGDAVLVADRSQTDRSNARRAAGRPPLLTEAPPPPRRALGAAVTLNGTVAVVHENESIHLPIGSTHQLANPGKIELELIEVQTGSYVGEDDILRIDDDFNRI